MHAGNRINISLKCILRSPRSHGYCVSISVYTWAPIFHWIILLFRQSRYIRARQRIILRQRGQARCCMHNTVNLSQGRRVKNHFTQPQPGKSNPARKTYLFRWSIKMFRCLDVKGTASVHTYLFTHLFFSHPRNAMPLPRYQGKRIRDLCASQRKIRTWIALPWIFSFSTRDQAGDKIHRLSTVYVDPSYLEIFIGTTFNI